MNYIVKDYLNPTREDNIAASKVIGEWWDKTSSIGFSPLGLVELTYIILIKKLGEEETDEIYKEIASDLPTYIINNPDVQEVIKDAVENVDESVLKCIISNSERLTDYDRYYGENTTPESISKLAIDVLDVQDNLAVIDICCGLGSFLEKTYEYNKTKNIKGTRLFGVDINAESILYAKIRSKVMNTNIEYELNNVFSFAKNNKLFDRAFSNYPFGMRIRELGEGYYYLEELQEKIPQISKATSSDWVFNSLAIDSLKKDGRAVCVMTNGATSNTTDRAIRKYFVDNKFIKAVIALPQKLFDITHIPTTMIVFEKKENNEILFIDATEIYQKGRRMNSFSDEDINKILDCFRTETEYSRKVSIEEVKEQNYNLTPSRYLASYIAQLAVRDGVEFGSVMKNITRGASIKADDLDDLTSQTETDYQYLMLSNIQDGMIQEDLPYLKKIDDNLKKYCLKEGDLIFSKNGYPYKVAVVGKTDKQILANGNLFIIELDRDKANPYYIKALFESEKGIALLKSITVGATIPNFGAAQLKSLIIPVPDITKQNEIANEYFKIDDEINVLKLRIKKIQERKNSLFEELSEGE